MDPNGGKAVHPSRNHVLDRRRRCLVPDVPLLTTDLHQVRKYAAKVGMAHGGFSGLAGSMRLPSGSRVQMERREEGRAGARYATLDDRKAERCQVRADLGTRRSLQIAHGQHEMIQRRDQGLSVAHCWPQAPLKSGWCVQMICSSASKVAFRWGR